MKLNKQIKTHIADMAIRKKYKAKFESKLAKLTVKAREVLIEINHNEDFDLLPERAKRLIKKCNGVEIPSLIMCSRIGGFPKVERGYQLDIAFDTYSDINSLSFDKPVYASGNHRGLASFPEELSEDFKALQKFLKEASTARQTLLDAMAHYKSSKKMFAELPWSEDFYPEQEKKPACNIVPVSTIAAANELMGV